MKFTTEVEIEPSIWKIAHGETIWTIGSCFADNLGSRMADRLLRVRVNPFGALYNPASIAGALRAAIDARGYSPEEMVESQGLWHCMDYATTLSRPTAEETAEAVNSLITSLHAALPHLHTLIITFGSTHIFTDLSTGLIAGNCHKLPASRFAERELSIDEIVEEWNTLIARLRSLRPGLHILFSVSPVRHKAYGLHADRLSKSRLLIAVDELCRRCNATYFPAYELLDDELRDYRFYAADMVHPSDVAADYIFERWAQTFCTEQTRRLFTEALRLTSRLKHRPIAGMQTNDFQQSTKALANRMAAEHPEMTEAIAEILQKTTN